MNLLLWIAIIPVAMVALILIPYYTLVVWDKYIGYKRHQAVLKEMASK